MTPFCCRCINKPLSGCTAFVCLNVAFCCRAQGSPALFGFCLVSAGRSQGNWVTPRRCLEAPPTFLTRHLQLLLSSCFSSSVIFRGTQGLVTGLFINHHLLAHSLSISCKDGIEMNGSLLVEFHHRDVLCSCTFRRFPGIHCLLVED